MLSGWLSLVFANQLCGILMRELTASYSACVPSNRSLSSESHLHGRRLCFVGKDFTICHSLCHPTSSWRNLLIRLAFFFSLSFFLFLSESSMSLSPWPHTQTRMEPHETFISLLLSSGPAKKGGNWCDIINRIVFFKCHVYPQYFCSDFLPQRLQCAPLSKRLSACCHLPLCSCEQRSNLVWWILHL